MNSFLWGVWVCVWIHFFFCMWMSSYYSTTCGPDFFSPIVLVLHFCQRSVDYIYVALFLRLTAVFHWSVCMFFQQYHTGTGWMSTCSLPISLCGFWASFPRLLGLSLALLHHSLPLRYRFCSLSHPYQPVQPQIALGSTVGGNRKL